MKQYLNQDNQFYIMQQNKSNLENEFKEIVDKVQIVIQEFYPNVPQKTEKFQTFKQLISRQFSLFSEKLLNQTQQINHKFNINLKTLDQKEIEIAQLKLEIQTKNQKNLRCQNQIKELKKQIEKIKKVMLNNNKETPTGNQIDPKIIKNYNQQQYKKLINSNKEMEIRNTDLNKSLQQIENKKQRLQKKMIEIQYNNKKMQSQKKEIAQQIQIMKDERSKFYKNLEQIKIQLQKAVNARNRYLTPDAVHNYDISIKLNSIRDFFEGLQITYQNQLKYKIQKVVGIMGSKKSGKTYILNKLSGQIYQHGYDTNTSGICFKTPSQQLRNILFVDSAGSNNSTQFDKYQQSAIGSKQQEQQILEKLQQLKLTQKLIENYIIKISDLVIIVIDNFDLNDQQKISGIILSNEKEYKNKIFYVIHNFKNLYNRAAVQKKIQRNIIKGCFAKKHDGPIKNLKNNKIEKFEYYVSETKSGASIYHYVLVEQLSDLANQINWKTYESLRTQIRNPTATQPFSIKDTFIEFSTNFLKKYYNYSENLCIKSQKIITQEKSMKVQKLFIPNEKKLITLKNNLAFNLLDRRVEANWAYSIINMESKKSLQVYFDISGLIINFTFQIIKIMPYVYEITIKYNRSYESDYEEKKIIIGNRDIDPNRNQTITFVLNISENKLELDIDEIIRKKKSLINYIKNGTYTLSLPLVNPSSINLIDNKNKNIIDQNQDNDDDQYEY